jgi:hypothetical protein
MVDSKLNRATFKAAKRMGFFAASGRESSSKVEVQFNL